MVGLRRVLECRSAGGSRALRTFISRSRNRERGAARRARVLMRDRISTTSQVRAGNFDRVYILGTRNYPSIGEPNGEGKEGRPRRKR